MNRLAGGRERCVAWASGAGFSGWYLHGCLPCACRAERYAWIGPFRRRSYLASFAALAAGAGGVEALWRTMLGHARAYYAETSAERRAAMVVEDKAAIAELAARGAGQSPFSKPAARRYAGSILRAGLVWQQV